MQYTGDIAISTFISDQLVPTHKFKINQFKTIGLKELTSPAFSRFNWEEIE